MVRGSGKKVYRKSANVKDYVNDMKLLEFYFDPNGKWHDCHGDNKATTKGVYVARTQASTENPPRYLVQIYNQIFQFTAEGPWAMEPGPDGKRPSDVDVLAFLREKLDMPPQE